MEQLVLELVSVVYNQLYVLLPLMVHLSQDEQMNKQVVMD
ncbi:unnamed protein product [Schistosoma curassoni]|uniref:Uncharacterized protein n=1 Tax=Schistosoma curassoni TaxID=6186 RepID=A0A183JF08_9TREM|nr:unnamed protein product [Schistosoma curassoni]